jgi:hypothetical protein
MPNANRLAAVTVAILLLPQIANASPPVPRSTQEVRAALAREIDFPGITDPETTLEKALTLLSERSGLRFCVNNAAFQLESDDDELQQPLKRRLGVAIPGRSAVSVDRVLRDVLSTVWASRLPRAIDPLTGKAAYDGDLPTAWCGAIYVVRPGGVEITTATFLWARRQLCEPPVLNAAQLERVRQVRALLDRKVDFPGINDPKTQLRDVLALFADCYGLHVSANQIAFRSREAVDLLFKAEVAPTLLPPMKNVPLREVVRCVLNRLPDASPVPFGVLYAVGPDGIELTTETNLVVQSLPPQPIPAPTPSQLQRARNIRDTLVRRSHFVGFNDPEMTLADALAFLSKRYNLRIEVNEWALEFDDVYFPLRQTIYKPIPAADGMLPRDVLEMVLARIPARSGAIFVIRPHGYIELTTRGYLLAEQQGLHPSYVLPVVRGDR